MGRLSPWVLGIAGALVVVLLVLAGQYGFHRDELYLVVAGRHPSLGYVDQPPLTPILSAAAVAILGATPVAVRILPAVAAGLVLILAADMARRFGGGPWAQVLAALAMTTTGLIAVGHLASTTTFDILAWTVVLWLAVILLDGGDPRLWVALGVAAGIGLENKYILAFLGAGLAVGLVLARRWDVVRSPWAWSALGIALVLWAPNLAWQAANGWPQLEMASVLARRARAESGALWAEVFLLAGSLAVFVPLIGVGWLLAARAARPWRPIGWAALAVVAIVLATSGKSYYMVGSIAALVAAGAVAIDRWITRGRAMVRATPVVAAIVVAATLMAVLVLPVVPPSSLRSTPIPDLYGEAGEQIGWPELVASVEAAVDGIPAGERASTVILTANYGEAGAIELLGQDLPPVYSGHNGYWEWGPPPDGTTVAILVSDGGYRAPGIGGCTPAGRVDNGLGVDNDEQGTAILVCRNVPSSWREVWRMFRHLD